VSAVSEYIVHMNEGSTHYKLDECCLWFIGLPLQHRLV
jgi:hypothetical protein